MIQDHPRVCGEKKSGMNFLEMKTGSPPRVRGKGADIVISRYAKGITPACAGKRSGHVLSCFQNEDHPRVCGEKPFRFASIRAASGSPPRVRGKD